VAKWHCPLDKSNQLFREGSDDHLWLTTTGCRTDIDRASSSFAGMAIDRRSCMVLFERCDGPLLESSAARSKVDIGLHFSLTNENLPLSPPLEKSRLPNFKTLFRRTLFRSLKSEEITGLLTRNTNCS